MKSLFFSGAFAAVACLSVAFADDPNRIVYDSEAKVADLTSGDAWIGGVAPGEDDIAVFDGTLPAQLELDDETTWYGLVRTNITGEVAFHAPAGGTLTIGASGISFAAGPGAKADELQKTVFYVDVIAGCEQTWEVLWKSRTPHFRRNVKANGRLHLKGLRHEVFYGEIDAEAGGLDMANEAVYLASNAVVKGEMTIAPGSLLAVVKPQGTYAFGDIFTSKTVKNTGVFDLGSEDSNTSWFIPKTITLGEGESIVGPCDPGVSSRGNGLIHLQDVNLVVTNGTMPGNTWFQLHSGSYVQDAGSADFAYAAIIGRHGVDGCKLKEQSFTINDGTFSARRFTVGVANGENVPAGLYVNGGRLESSLPNEDYWAAALAVGAVTASDERDAGGMLLQSDRPAAEAVVSGGTVKVPSIRYGSDRLGSNKDDTATSSRFWLKGGELNLGGGGIKTGDGWRPQNDAYAETLFSGGKLTAYKNFTISSRLRIENWQGGTEWNVDNGRTMTVAGPICGSGGIRKTGAGTLVIAGCNESTGRVDIVEGRLNLGLNVDYAIWRPDTVMYVEGPLAEWKALASGTSNDTFLESIGQSALAIPAVRGPAVEVASDGTFAGHAVAVFANQNAMAVTGNAKQALSQLREFSITVVLSADAGFSGVEANDWDKATGILGCTIPSSQRSLEDCRNYGLSINDKGQVGCGMTWQDDAKKEQRESLWNDQVTVNDGKPHVVVWTWKLAGKHTLSVDDKTVELSSPSNANSKAFSTVQTRFIVGASERSKSAANGFFRGRIAEIRCAQSCYDAATRQRRLKELGERYGVEAYPSTAAAAAPETTGVTVPSSTATFTADSLGTPGSAVSEWPNASGTAGAAKWTLNTSLASSVISGIGSSVAVTSPTVCSETVNGHKLLSFNGTSDALGVTGTAETPASDASGLTVAIVARFPKFGYGASMAEAWTNFGAIVSSAYEDSAYNQMIWGITYTGAGRLAARMRVEGKTISTALTKRRFFNDGRLHLIVVTYPKKNDANGKVAITVDGFKTEVAGLAGAHTTIRTRLMLGGAELGRKASFVAMDLAELSFWKNTILTDDQIKALGAQMEAKYGLVADGFDFASTATVSASQRPRIVCVHENGSFAAPYLSEVTLYDGQTLCGNGTVGGWLSVSSGATLEMSSSGTPRFTSVTLQDGAILKAADAAFEPIRLTGDLRLPAGTVHVTVPAGAETHELLSWTGNLASYGETTFAGHDDQGRPVKVKVDAANKRLLCTYGRGLTILIR